jgi:predicted MFS family arabinose efflux permease
MLGTGLGFAGTTLFWALLIVAFVGTINPSSGDVSVFLPTEQGVLPSTVAATDRTWLFGWYNMAGALAGAMGSVLAGLPSALATQYHWGQLTAERSAFLLYSGTALVIAALYSLLTPAIEPPHGKQTSPPLTNSRRVVIHLSALFCLDSFGGGFIVQSLLVLWLFKRFHMDIAKAGAVFFVTGLLSALSQLGSPWLARRIGLIPTMVYTHLPSNAFLVIAAFMPTASLAILFLCLRSLLSQMDVPARQSYVMAVVHPDERAAAASVTNVPRSLAAGLSPLLAGLFLDWSSFGWPLVAAGVLKALYDVLLLIQFQSLKPPEEVR